ncbi:hypothetical protein QP028_13175 [Corynebacterium suedekumii]|nr:hypothetical protein QP028_13175 [Corynebacterium suedekumii]
MALLIAGYVVVAALEINRGIVAPAIVIAIAAILFWPRGRKDRQPDPVDQKNA